MAKTYPYIPSLWVDFLYCVQDHPLINWPESETTRKQIADVSECNSGRKIKRNPDGSAQTEVIETLLHEMRAVALEEFSVMSDLFIHSRINVTPSR